MAGRCPNTEFVLPVIVGTVAIHLGKKVCHVTLAVALDTISTAQTAQLLSCIVSTTWIPTFVLLC
jgi:hypothetical protein